MQELKLLLHYSCRRINYSSFNLVLIKLNTFQEQLENQNNEILFEKNLKS